MAKLEKKKLIKLKIRNISLKNSILESIVAKDYQTFFKEYVDNKPKKYYLYQIALKLSILLI